MFLAVFWVIFLLKHLSIVKLKSLEADLDRTVNTPCFTDKAWHSLETGGDHARLSLSDKLHWHSVLDYEDKYDPAHVKRQKSDTWYSIVNKSKAQPTFDTFIIMNLSDIQWREWLSLQLGEVRQEAQCENHFDGPQKLLTHTLKKTHTHTHATAHNHNHTYSVCVGACEKRLPPPLREHRKLETIQRLHAGFSSKLFPPQQPACEQAQHPIRPTTYPLG